MSYRENSVRKNECDMKTAETQDLYFYDQFLFLIRIWKDIAAQKILTHV